MSQNDNDQTTEGIEKLKELVEEIDTCLFCTNLKIDDGSTCRPMSAQKVDDEANLWFFSEIDSDKNREIEKDRHVQLFFSHPGKNSYLVVNGEAEIITDRNKIEELWTPMVKAWFKEGKDDPNISLIKVNSKSAYYWDVEGNKMINFLKMVASAATGKNLVSSKEGSIIL
ncbi:MAG: pyridoxamine 5'-phosphate oxidase family protein [Ignavibacteria bacterium]